MFEPCVLYLHCGLNLTVADNLKGFKIMSDILHHALEISYLEGIFHKLKKEISPQVLE